MKVLEVWKVLGTERSTCVAVGEFAMRKVKVCSSNVLEKSDFSAKKAVGKFRWLRAEFHAVCANSRTRYFFSLPSLLSFLTLR